jgi:hypothetical protein
MTTTKTIFEENNEKFDNNNHPYDINSYIQNSPSHIYNLEGKDDVFEEELSHNSYNLYNTASNTKKIRTKKKLMEDILSEKNDNYDEEIKSGEIVDNFKSINKKDMKLDQDLPEEELSENNNNNIYNIGTNIKRIQPEKDLIIISQKSSDKNTENIIPLEEENENNINSGSEIIENNENTENTELYDFEKINKEIIPKLDLSEKVKNKIIKDKDILQKIEKNEKILENNEITTEQNNNEIKQGRKKLGDKSRRKHNRSSYDNVIKKVKTELFKYALLFINQILNALLSQSQKESLIDAIRNNKNVKNKSEDLLKILDYQYTNKISKKHDLGLIKMAFKDLFSQEISGRYSSLKKESNKIIIDNLLKDVNIDVNIKFILNLKFGDWIDYFTYKKEIKKLDDLKKEKNIEIKMADTLLNDIGSSENDDTYFCNFLFHLINYKWWFQNKRGRERNVNKKKNKKFGKI